MSFFGLFKSHSKNEQADSFAAYLPADRTFAAKRVEDTNLRNFILALSNQLINFEQTLNLFTNELGPLESSSLLPEWERMLGIPDDCFLKTGPIEERRRDVLIKLASLSVQTKEDFEALALLFGVVVTVLAGDDIPPTSPAFPAAFPKFTIYVEFGSLAVDTFPFTFPFTFGNSSIDIMQCLFSNLKPANTVLIFQEV